MVVSFALIPWMLHPVWEDGRLVLYEIAPTWVLTRDMVVGHLLVRWPCSPHSYKLMSTAKKGIIN